MAVEAEYRGSPFLAQVIGDRLRRRMQRARKTYADLTLAGCGTKPTLISLFRGERRPNPSRVVTVAHVLGCTADEVEELRVLAVEAARPGWWEGLSTPAEMRLYLDLESRAREIAGYEPGLVPGLLQTEAYARELAGHAAAGAEASLRLKQERQQRLHRAGDPPRPRYVVGQAALHRPVHDPGVLREQVDHLEALCRAGTAEVRVLPREVPWSPAASGGPFTVVVPHAGTTVVYQELLDGARYVEEEEAVERYLRAWQELWQTGSPLATTDGPPESPTRKR